MIGKFYKITLPGIGHGDISPVGYSAQFTFLGNSMLPLSTNIMIKANAAFALRRITTELINLTAGGPVTDPSGSGLTAFCATLQITDQSSGKTIFTVAPTLNTISGNAQRPYGLSSPLVFQASGTVSLNITPLTVANLIAADNYQFSINLDGDNLWLPFDTLPQMAVTG